MTAYRNIFTSAALFILLMVAPVIAFAVPAPLVKTLAPVTNGVKSPVRVAVDGNGGFYVSDPKAGAILHYKLDGTLLTTIPFKKAQGLAVTATGNLLVGHGDTVSIIDTTGNEIRTLGKGAGQFKLADGIAIDPAGYIYVADALDNTVQVFNSAGAPANMAGAVNGKPGNSFGTDGSGNGQLSMPTGIAFEKSTGWLAVADTLNGRVQFFDAAGIWKKSLGGTGSAVSFTMPVSVAFDYNSADGALKRMYVTDSFQSGVQVVDPASAPVSLGYIGGYGKVAGKLMNPYGAVIDHSSSTLLVANGFGNVSLWGIDGGGSLPNSPPPLLVIDSFPNVTASPVVTLSGITDAGVKLTAAFDTSATVGTPVVTGTAWSLQVSGLLPGVNTITLTATDAFGGSTAVATSVIFNASATFLAINGVTTPTNLNSQKLTGSMEAGATVAVSVVSPAVAGAVTYPTATTWNCTLSSLTIGDNLVTVSADLAGKVSASTTATITVKGAPALTLYMPQDGSVAGSQLFQVNGETDADVTAVTINGVQSSVSGGIFSRAILLAGGTNIITVSVTDSLGSSTSKTLSITYDPSAPAVTISSPTAGSVVNSLAPVVVSGTFTGSASSIIKVNGVTAVIAGSSWSATVSPVAGIYGINVTVTDGSKQSVTATFINIVDLTLPTITISKPAADLLTSVASTTVSGNAKGTGVTAALNGAPLPITFDPATGNFDVTVTATADGAYVLVVTTTDVFGASSRVFRTIVFKTASPKLAVTSQSSTAVAGTGDAGSTVYVRDAAGNVIGSAPVSAAGTWSIPLSGAATPLNIYALDAVGNNSRNGNITGSGTVGLADALKALKFSVGIEKPTADEFLRGDVAPLVSGISRPDGKIDIDDVMLILMKVIGQLW